ncbi:MAG TPA: hypothetical protein VII40_05415 [Xanthobacteraceae bacterium]
MGKRKADQPNSPAQDGAGSEPVKLESPSVEAAPPAEGFAKIEAPDLAPVEPSVAAAPAEAITPSPPTPPVVPPVMVPPVVAPPVVAIDGPTLEASDSAPPIALPEPIEPVLATPVEAAAPAASDASSSAASTLRRWTKVPRVTPLAAGIAIAAVVGAMAGSAATAGLVGLWAGPPASAKTAEKAADARPLRETIARLNSELVALKASIENSGRTSNAQFSKLGDRLDRVEHAQAEPAAKLTKLTEAVDRIEHRAPVPANTPHDVTGSIAAPAPPAQPAAVPARLAGPPILDGWFVRSVYNGAALIQARYGGVIEVEPGDSLPGLGRIENIHRQDGRWVVVTSKGMIVAR